MKLKMFYNTRINQREMIKDFVNSGGTLEILCTRLVLMGISLEHDNISWRLINAFAEKKWGSWYTNIKNENQEKQCHILDCYPNLVYFLKNPLLNRAVSNTFLRFLLAYEETGELDNVSC